MQLTVGSSVTHNHANNLFFGPGTGSGASLNDNGPTGNFVFGVTVFQPLTPNFGVGAGALLITPPLNPGTSSGITSNGIAVSSRFEPGIAFDPYGEAYFTFPLGPASTPVTLELGGGEEFGNAVANTLAPSVGDSFIRGQHYASPFVITGVQVPACGLLPIIVPLSDGSCPINLGFEYQHVFNDFIIHNGPGGGPSDSVMNVGGTDRFMFELHVNTGANPTNTPPPAYRNSDFWSQGINFGTNLRY